MYQRADVHDGKSGAIRTRTAVQVRCERAQYLSPLPVVAIQGLPSQLGHLPLALGPFCRCC